MSKEFTDDLSSLMQGGSLAYWAKRANLCREHLYRTLSVKGNPKVTSTVSLFNAIGFSWAVEPHTCGIKNVQIAVNEHSGHLRVPSEPIIHR